MSGSLSWDARHVENLSSAQTVGNTASVNLVLLRDHLQAAPAWLLYTDLQELTSSATVIACFTGIPSLLPFSSLHSVLGEQQVCSQIHCSFSPPCRFSPVCVIRVTCLNWLQLWQGKPLETQDTRLPLSVDALFLPQ